MVQVRSCLQSELLALKVWPRPGSLLWNERSEIQRKRTWAVIFISVKWGDCTKRPLRAHPAQHLSHALNCLAQGLFSPRSENDEECRYQVRVEDGRKRTATCCHFLSHIQWSCLDSYFCLCCSFPASTSGFAIFTGDGRRIWNPLEWTPGAVLDHENTGD